MLIVEKILIENFAEIYSF